MTKSKKGQNIISKMPRDRILIETDAPFIKDVLPYKNFNVYYYLSTIWNESIDYVIKKTFDNFINLQDNKKNNLFG